MKKIVFFSRSRLTDLYGLLTPYLEPHHEIIHLAYSEQERDILIDKYSISKVEVFFQKISELYKKEKVDLELCEDIDAMIIEQSNNRFNLSGALQYDRTFQYLSYEEGLRMAQVYYRFWNHFLDENEVDYVVHEPTSLYFNHIAALLCKQKGKKYITFIQLYGEKENNFTIISGDKGIPDVLNQEIEKIKDYKLSESDITKVKSFLDKKRITSEVLFNQYSRKKSVFRKLTYNTIRIFVEAVRNKLRYFSESKESLNHLNLFFYKEFSMVDELRKTWSSNVFRAYDTFNPNDTFYFYPLHLEPEAVVLYWGDGIYKNQVKLIENIAAQLPTGSYLYVKDHPHGGDYRDPRDFAKIKAIPNVKLINPSIPGKALIYHSIGVITINGTAGFEAILMNKQIYTFGNSFYNGFNRINYIHNIRNLREVLYHNRDIQYQDDEELYKYLYAYLNAIYEGFTDYFVDFPELVKIEEKSNTKKVSEQLLIYFD